jgi:hypothetical protein
LIQIKEYEFLNGYPLIDREIGGYAMRHFLSVLAISTMICISAKAEEVTFTFRGTVHELDSEFYHFGGRPFEITYTFERTTKNSNSGGPESSNYIGAINSGRLTIYADTKPCTWVINPDGPGNVIEVKHLKNSHSYTAGANISGQAGNEVPATFIVELTDDSAAALSNNVLPASLNLESFGSRRIVRFTFTGASKVVFYGFGIITSGDTPAPQE